MEHPPGRVAAIDAVRGVAVLGILLLNIIGLAMPGDAAIDPYLHGGADPLNRAVWAANFVLADGKMRGLFSMLFGAGVLLAAERAGRAGGSPARTHYARMAWLLAFGMLHAWLIWYGDILVLYAIAGMLIFPAWRWRTHALVGVAATLIALQIAFSAANYAATRHLEEAAAAPGASAAAVARWDALRTAMTPSPADAAAEIAAYRGSYADAFAERAATVASIQTWGNLFNLPDTLALLALGMALARSGFFSGRWSRRAYVRIALAGPLLVVPLYLPLLWWLEATRHAPMTMLAVEPIHLNLLRPVLALSYAAAVVLLVASDRARWLVERLVATGRMALSNYLGCSIVLTLLFNGYGLGWYGQLQRWQCYPVVLAAWIVMLIASHAWLGRFAQGPLEWLWRSLVRRSSRAISRERVIAN